ncbi:hypothetical protein CASFOL_029108 [Castilleja foliolosa]|uniref:Uncharacterized protein n=1 Tax=Castilleja foliolosa TaxID=1961234 RepID=A0ABD3CG49_9LAMI
MMKKAGEGSSRTIDGPGRAHSQFTKVASDIPKTLSIEYLVRDDSPRVPFSSSSKLFTHDDGGLRIVNYKDDKANLNKGLILRPHVGPTPKGETANQNKGFMSMTPYVGPTPKGEMANRANSSMSVRPYVGPTEMANHAKSSMSVRPYVGPSHKGEMANRATSSMSVRPYVGPTPKGEIANRNKAFMSARSYVVPAPKDEMASSIKSSVSVRPYVGPAGKDEMASRIKSSTSVRSYVGPDPKDVMANRIKSSMSARSYVGPDPKVEMANRNKSSMSVRPHVGPTRKNQLGVTKLGGSVVRGAGIELEKFPKYPNVRKDEVNVANKFAPTTCNRRDSQGVTGLEKKYDVTKKVNPITFNQREPNEINDAVKKINMLTFNKRVSESSDAMKKLDAVTVTQRESISMNGSNKRKYETISIRELVADKKPCIARRPPIKQVTSCIPKKEFKGPKIEYKAPKIEDKYKVPNFKEFSFLKSTPGGFPKQSAREDTSGSARPVNITVSNGNSVGASRATPLMPKKEIIDLDDVVEVKPTPFGVQKQRTHEDISRQARPITNTVSNGNSVCASRTLPSLIRPKAEIVELDDVVEVKPTPFGVEKQSHTVSYGNLVSASQISTVKAPISPVGASHISALVSQMNLVAALQTTALNRHINHMGVGSSRIRQVPQVKLEDALEDLSQPKTEATVPDGLLAVPLMKHQRIALSWMVNQETNCKFCCGGILADDQGLGKTISTIALILKERSPSPKPPKPNDAEQTLMDMLNSIDRPPAGTLIVCPTSVLRQWSQELVNKVTPEANLSVLVYHGANRTKDPDELAKYDVVVTTYALVGQEVPKEPAVNSKDDPNPSPVFNFGKKKLFQSQPDHVTIPGPLSQVEWFRVVLDEAQCIKNHRTRSARACWGLHTKRRWCLSGTPIQNTIEDLYSYFRFLKYDPYADFRTFCWDIKAPIITNEKSAYERLRAVLKTFLLRRTKSTYIDGEPIIILPPKTIELQRIEFSEEERGFYNRLEIDSRAQFQEYAAAGTVKQHYAIILVMLLRLRQACGHPYLVDKSKYSSKSTTSLMTAKKLPREKQLSLLDCLEASSSICGICNDSPDDAVVTMCEHVYCHQCICELMVGDDTECPADNCNTNLVMANVFSKDTLQAAISGQESVATCPVSRSSTCCPLTSSKIKATLKLLLSITKPQRKVETDPETSDKLLLSITKPERKVETDLETSDKLLLSITKPQIKVEMDPETSDFVGGKAIVFSQWTKMLDILEDCLKEYSIEYRRLDGTMSVSVRDQAVKDFNTLPEVGVMIMSLKAASLGLNMVSANNVILLDLWWNPTTEDQAIDRAHRIGQTRPVSVYRLTVEETIEDRILELQQKKRELVSSAFGEKGPGGGKLTRLSVKELAFLFGA